jgi:hypothetical protein
MAEEQQASVASAQAPEETPAPAPEPVPTVVPEAVATEAAAPEIPKKYKAAVYDEPGKVSTKIVELDTPEPGPGEVLIKL